MPISNTIDYRKSIIKMVDSDTYQELRSYFLHKSIFNILGVARNENIHSNFISWLLNRSENHGLGDYPIKKFLEMLVITQNDTAYSEEQLFPDDLIDIIISGNYEIISMEVVREKAIPKGRIDIFVDVKILSAGDQINIKIILENKIYSKEHSDQTQIYYDWAKKEYGNLERLIFVFLTPLPTSELQSLSEQQCSCKKYIQINYQYLVDYLLEPCRKQEMPQESSMLIDNYLRSLSLPTLDFENGLTKNFGGMTMAVSERERKLLLDFWENNKPLLLATLNVLKDDDDINEDEKLSMQNMINVISTKSSRDYTHYKFKGIEYTTKNRLVYAVVKEYVASNNLTFKQIKSIFESNLQGSLGVVCRINDIKDFKRYYTKPQDVLVSHDNIEFAVCNQWGIDNIGKFINKAKELGYDIEEV